jgi:urease accessory protein
VIRDAAPATRPGWSARLALRFEDNARVTRLTHNRHEGPLRLLRALPQADGSAHAVIVHPPGGLVGGDTLELGLELGPQARVLCTTPGAQKWYRAERCGAWAQTRLHAGAQAQLEWLPQPTLVFDAAQVDQRLDIDLHDDARSIGWECLVLGRAAMGERYRRGSLKQSLRIRRAGQLVWDEQLVADATDRLFVSPLGWGERIAACTVWACGPTAAVAELLALWREAIDGAQASPAGLAHRLQGGATLPTPGLLTARLLADDALPLMQLAEALWSVARPVLLDRFGQPPRIWAT